MTPLFRSLPSMDLVLSLLEERYPDVTARVPRSLLRELATAFLDGLRASIAAGHVRDVAELDVEVLLPRLAVHVRDTSRPHLRRVLNATGVVIHTNLGRSLLAPEAVEAVAASASTYSNLEFDLATGKRGSRYSHVEELICALTGAESAMAVNNNAAAVLLVLDTLCKGREVVVSRGQLVEIGGSFRIPEVMEKSGCFLREVGATNRTHLRDYETALGEQSAAILKVHTSNYRIIGFVSEVPAAALARLAAEHGLPLIEDLGSGSLCDFTAAGCSLLAGEPVARTVIADGVDVVTFSGDKVLGGPQAGIIAGKKQYLDRIKKNPLARALRIDKLTLAALEATLRLYRDPETVSQRVPTLRMIAMGPEDLRVRARKLAQKMKRALREFPGVTVALLPGTSRVGGGAYPERELPTTLAAVGMVGVSPDTLRERLLRGDLPLVGRVEQGAFCLDPRTLGDGELAEAAAALRQAFSHLS